MSSPHSQIRAASTNSAAVPAQIDTASMTTAEKIKHQKDTAKQMERMGSRGASRQTIDESDLPIQIVKLITSRPSDMKELYFGYYPKDILAWPFFYRKLWDPRNWDLSGIIRFWKPANWSFDFPNPIAYYHEWREKGPKALELWMDRVQNHYANLEAMRTMAQYQRFPEYRWPESKMASRAINWDWHKDWRLRMREDRLLGDLTAGDNSPLRRILLDAADVYVAMNSAVSDGKTSRLADYAAKSYLSELEKRARRIHDCRKAETPIDYKWEFGHWINPPQCLSIRSHDYFSNYSKAYITGDRLYVNMLVKFESVQTMTITESFRSGPLGGLQYREPQVHTREVTEYLVLDVRTWVPGRKPKFVVELFEGQKVAEEIQSIDLSEDEKKPSTAQNASDATEVAVPVPAA